MQAIILAAGMGKRLGELTSGNTKCMVEVNGIKLIDRMLKQLSAYPLTQIIIVIGYKGKELKDYIRVHFQNLPLIFVENLIYDKTNNIYSLWLAKDLIAKEETILLESDLIFEDKVLDLAINSHYKNCSLVAKYEPWMDGTMVRIDDESNIINFIPKKAFKYNDIDYYYKTVNIYKFSKEFLNDHYLPFLNAYIKVLGENEYYEQVLRVITLIDSVDLKALPITGLKWYEIDDVQDLKIAETIFAEPKIKLEKLDKANGGFWRYPSLINFNNTVNPYFPPVILKEELMNNLPELIKNFPSSKNIDRIILKKYFNIKEEYIRINNRLDYELLNYLKKTNKKIGVLGNYDYIKTEETKDIIFLSPTEKNFTYNIENIKSLIEDYNIEILLIYNPDNISGNFIKNKNLFSLLEWTKNRNTTIIINESLFDFVNVKEESSLIKNEILEYYANLIIIKNLSYAYGIPGLSISIFASSKEQNLSIFEEDFNMTSLAEYYMQIFGKYEKNFIHSIKKLHETKTSFYRKLKKLKSLCIIESETNFFLCKISSAINIDNLLDYMIENNIYIKKNSLPIYPADSNYIKIGILEEDKNNHLIKILEEFENRYLVK